MLVVEPNWLGPIHQLGTVWMVPPTPIAVTIGGVTDTYELDGLHKR